MKKTIISVVSMALLVSTLAIPTKASSKMEYKEECLAGFDISVIHQSKCAAASTQSAVAVATAKPKAVATARPKATTPAKTYTRDKKYAKTRLKLRRKASKKSKIKTRIPVGAKVKRIYVKKNGWAKIKYKKKTGFVKNKYLVKKQPKIVKKSDTSLKGVRKRNADRIAKVCIKNYDTYGVLPSVSVAQAFIETGIGTAYNNGNLWGISSRNYGGFSSIEAGCIAYLKVINNGYYKGAPFAGSYQKQISRIIAGGYCGNPDGYVSNVIRTIERYNLTDYDKYI